MAAMFALGCVGVLLGLAVVGVVVSQTRHATPVVYLAALIVSVAACANAVAFLLASPPPSSAELPLGLPWLGAHFRVDALSAFFLVLINLGAAVASLYAVGYGQHEEVAGTGAAVLSGLSRRHEPRSPGGRRLYIPPELGADVALLLGSRHGASQGR